MSGRHQCIVGTAGLVVLGVCQHIVHGIYPLSWYKVLCLVGAYCLWVWPPTCVTAGEVVKAQFIPLCNHLYVNFPVRHPMQHCSPARAHKVSPKHHVAMVVRQLSLLYLGEVVFIFAVGDLRFVHVGVAHWDPVAARPGALVAH